MRIGVCIPLSDTLLAHLRREANGFAVIVRDDGGTGDCEIVFGNPDPLAVQANASLRWLQLESVGFGEYAGLNWERGTTVATVTNLAGFFSDPVAESALAGILALYRGIDRLIQLQAAQQWVGDALRTKLMTLQGPRVVLFGYGAINRRLAELLAPFGCEIIRIASADGLAALDQALDVADIVVCCVPSTPATSNLFDRERLARMRPGALFCNFGRGSLLNEDMLSSALKEGRLGGAVIDVTRDEPLPAEHPFWTCPNLILTQHTGGGTADELSRKVDVFLANLALFRAGEPLKGVVDFSRGY
jgi:phosphoglycerate dehydrogenase-like enzyme